MTTKYQIFFYLIKELRIGQNVFKLEVMNSLYEKKNSINYKD